MLFFESTILGLSVAWDGEAGLELSATAPFAGERPASGFRLCSFPALAAEPIDGCHRPGLVPGMGRGERDEEVRTP